MIKIRKILIVIYFGIFSILLIFFIGWVLIKVKNGKADNNVQQSNESLQTEKGSVIKYIDIDDAVIVSEENLKLAFPFSGKIEKIFSPEGTSVKKGDSLIKLELTELELENKVLKASLDKAQANLDKILSGATEESIQIYKGKADASNGLLKDAKKVLVDIIRSAYTSGEDAVRGKTNQLFSNPNSSNPQLVFSVSDSGLENDIEAKRSSLEGKLDKWKDSTDALDYLDNLDDKIDEADAKLDSIQSYLDKVAEAVNQLTATDSLSKTTLDSWNSAISSARTNVDTAMIAIKSAMTALTEADGNRDIAIKSLSFANSKSRNEDIRLAQAEVDIVSNQIGILTNKLEKATLKAPQDGRVMKILFKESEIVPGFPDGQTVVFFSAFNQKMQADVSEEDIPNVQIDNLVNAKIKALPNEKITGKVTSINPQPINKNGDVYYKIDISIDGFIPDIREGMTADIKIKSGQKDAVIRVPNRYIERAGGKVLVNVIRSGRKEKVEVETGFYDDNFTEIESGISEKEIILLPQY